MARARPGPARSRPAVSPATGASGYSQKYSPMGLAVLFQSLARSRLVIRVISSVLWLKVSHTSVTVFLTRSALWKTRFAKWRCFRTEETVSIGFSSGLQGDSRSSEKFDGISRSFDLC